MDFASKWTFIGKNELFINYITYNFSFIQKWGGGYYWLFIIEYVYNVILFLFFIQQVSPGLMVETEEYYVKYKN